MAHYVWGGGTAHPWSGVHPRGRSGWAARRYEAQGSAPAKGGRACACCQSRVVVVKVVLLTPSVLLPGLAPPAYLPPAPPRRGAPTPSRGRLGPQAPRAPQTSTHQALPAATPRAAACSRRPLLSPLGTPLSRSRQGLLISRVTGTTVLTVSAPRPSPPAPTRGARARAHRLPRDSVRRLRGGRSPRQPALEFDPECPGLVKSGRSHKSRATTNSSVSNSAATPAVRAVSDGGPPWRGVSFRLAVGRILYVLHKGCEIQPSADDAGTRWGHAPVRLRQKSWPHGQLYWEERTSWALSCKNTTQSPSPDAS